MKEAMLTLTESGDIAMEFGGDLANICCGTEDKKIQQALKGLGVEVTLKNVYCNLPNRLQIAAKENGNCITPASAEATARQGRS